MPDDEKPAPNASFTVERVLEALRQTGGNQSAAAAMLGTVRQTINGYVKRYRLEAEIRDIEEGTKDLAELGLLRKLKAEDWRAIEFYLKTKGKDRGYSTRVEMSGPDGEPVPVRHSYEHLTTDQLKELEASLTQAEAILGAQPGS